MTKSPSTRVKTPKSASAGMAKSTTISKPGPCGAESLTPTATATATAPIQVTAKPGPATVPVPPIAAAAPNKTKTAVVRARLATPGGVSLAELIEATGWQAHSLRAALTGLRKAVLTINRRREGRDTIYAIEDGRASDGPAVGPSIDAGAPAVPSPAIGGNATSLIIEPVQGAA